MIHAAGIPLWAAMLISFFRLAGGFFTLVGCIGLVRFRSFYERIHGPALGTSFGAAGILIASILFFSILQSRPVLHEVLIAVFIVVTTPVTLMLLSRAVIHRDSTQDSRELPAISDPADEG